MASAEESVPENSRDGTDREQISRDQTVNDVQAGHDRKAVDGKGKSSGSKKISSKKSGKKKKKRKTRTKREQEKLEKSVKKIQQDEDAMDNFVTKVNKWLCRHLPAVFLLFDTFDSNGTGFLSYRQFKTGLVELSIPCNKVEIHLLTQMLDEEKTNLIDYQKLTHGITQNRTDEFAKELGFCEVCGMGSENATPNKKMKRYVQLELRMATFNQIKNHRAHFFIVVLSNTLVQFIINQILLFTEISTTRMALFRDSVCSVDSLLPDDKFLMNVVTLDSARSTLRKLYCFMILE